MNPIRLSKMAIGFMVGCYFLLVVFNNLTDYPANYQFVEGVLSMEDRLSGQITSWRGMHGGPWVNLFYGIIIAVELAVSILCFVGFRALWTARFGHAKDFHFSKKWMIYGLTLALVLWVFAFITIGGEWFLMWQSESWNSLQTAFNHGILNTIFLIFISMKND